MPAAIDAAVNGRAAFENGCFNPPILGLEQIENRVEKLLVKQGLETDRGSSRPCA